jgi:hypothetical protein
MSSHTDGSFVSGLYKRRLPDTSPLHASFSDRYTGLHSEAIHPLSEVGPRDNLRGFAPTYEQFQRIPQPPLEAGPKASD